MLFAEKMRVRCSGRFGYFSEFVDPVDDLVAKRRFSRAAMRVFHFVHINCGSVTPRYSIGHGNAMPMKIINARLGKPRYANAVRGVHGGQRRYTPFAHPATEDLGLSPQKRGSR